VLLAGQPALERFSFLAHGAQLAFGHGAGGVQLGAQLGVLAGGVGRLLLEIRPELFELGRALAQAPFQFGDAAAGFLERRVLGLELVVNLVPLVAEVGHAALQLALPGGSCLEGLLRTCRGRLAVVELLAQLGLQPFLFLGLLLVAGLEDLQFVGVLTQPVLELFAASLEVRDGLLFDGQCVAQCLALAPEAGGLFLGAVA
jgi:hypothetical protein